MKVEETNNKSCAACIALLLLVDIPRVYLITYAMHIYGRCAKAGYKKVINI